MMTSSFVRNAVSLFALTIASGGVATAQHVSYLAPTEAQQDIAAENLSLAADSSLATAIQARFAGKQFENQFERAFDPGVAMVVRLAYANHLFEPIWTHDGAERLKDAYADQDQYGLGADSIAVTRLEETIDKRFGAGNVDDQASADLDLTLAWVALASRVSGGLADEGEARAEADDAPARPELVDLLTNAGQGEVVRGLAELEPQHPQYQKLRDSLQRYQDIADNGGWMAIADLDGSIKPGQSDPRIPAIRTRLAKEGYFVLPPIQSVMDMFAMNSSQEIQNVEFETNDDEGTDPENDPETKSEAQTDDQVWITTYDQNLETALKSFQARHGLETDGVIGPKTLEALNESAESKVERIRFAMDQWRAQPLDQERYVWANIPSYRVEGWANGRREISMKSIVGLPSRETPVFSDDIEYAVANPRWYAPTSIVARDKLPKLQRDPTYAARNGYRIYDRETGSKIDATSVDWTDPTTASSYQFVQAAGSNNALGNLKIIFPNQHSVYLHGTPDTHLFARNSRALSSGCVRLEDPVKMANWIAGGPLTEAGQDIETALVTGKNTKVVYENTTPVHITYITVTVDNYGRPSFWRDVYNRQAAPAMAEETAPLFEPGEDTGSDSELKIADMQLPNDAIAFH